MVELVSYRATDKLFVSADRAQTFGLQGSLGAGIPYDDGAIASDGTVLTVNEALGLQLGINSVASPAIDHGIDLVSSSAGQSAAVWPGHTPIAFRTNAYGGWAYTYHPAKGPVFDARA